MQYVIHNPVEMKTMQQETCIVGLFTDVTGTPK